MSKRGLWLLGALVVVVLIAVVATSEVNFAPKNTRTASCTDSDGGQNVDVFGEVCVSGSSSRSIGASSCVSDSCTSDGKVIERYCTANGAQSTVTECGPGLTCVEGICSIETGVGKSEARVFVTSDTWLGSEIGGLTGANAKCQAAADSAQLGGEWRAWLSDSSTSATENVVSNEGAYVMLDGTTIADNWFELVDGIIDSPLNLDENQNLVDSSQLRVWTGTNKDGTSAQDTCNDWTSLDPFNGKAGQLNLASSGWTEIVSAVCSTFHSFHLYCFEQIMNGQCGNSVIDAGEECDDGDNWSGNGCSSSCELEAGWQCSGTPTVCELEFEELEFDPTSVDDNLLGWAVDIDGNVAVVGAYGVNSGSILSVGAAYIYRFNSQTQDWEYEQELIAFDAFNNDQFGKSVAVSGDYVFIGSPQDDDNGFNSGSVYLYEYDGQQWNFVEKLYPGDGGASDYFGRTIAAEEDIFISGSNTGGFVEGTGAGAIYVYRFNSQALEWEEEQKLTGSDAGLGTGFGLYSLDVKGDWIFAGAHQDDFGGGLLDDLGAVYSFEYDSQTGQWSETQKLVLENQEVEDTFGVSIDLEENRAIIGAQKHIAMVNNPPIPHLGKAVIFELEGGSWIEKNSIIPSFLEEGTYYGSQVSMSGDYVFIGAFQEGSIANQAGKVYVYKKIGEEWFPVDELVNEDAETESNFGFRIASSDDYFVATSPNDQDSSQAEIGSISFYKVPE